MNMDADDIVVDQPVVATATVALVATVAYVGIQFVIDGVVAPVETAIFVAVFTVVYMSGNWYLRRREREDGDGDADGAGGSAETADADEPA
jgi:hypothetical protein